MDRSTRVVLLTVAMVIIVFTLPQLNQMRGGSRSYGIVFVEPDGSLRLVADWAPQAGPSYRCHWYCSVGTNGRLAATYRYRVCKSEVVPANGAPDVQTETWQRAVEMWSEHLLSEGWGTDRIPTPRLQISARTSQMSPIYSGYLWNSILLMCFGFVGFQLVAWPIRAAKAGRTNARLSQGLCTHCGYDLHGLAKNAVCPECGAAAVSSLART